MLNKLKEVIETHLFIENLRLSYEEERKQILQFLKENEALIVKCLPLMGFYLDSAIESYQIDKDDDEFSLHVLDLFYGLAGDVKKHLKESN